MELSRQQQDRRTKLRQLFNGPVAVRLLQQYGQEKSFSVSLSGVAHDLKSFHCDTDSTELRSALDGSLERGWSFDAKSDCLTFTQYEVTQPEPALNPAPGVSMADAAAALTDADKIRLRFNASPEIRARFSSLVRYQEAVRLGIA
jgi:hypothetical protein